MKDKVKYYHLLRIRVTSSATVDDYDTIKSCLAKLMERCCGGFCQKIYQINGMFTLPDTVMQIRQNFDTIVYLVP